MKQLLSILFIMIFGTPVMADNEIGPEGYKLFWILTVIVITFLLAFLIIIRPAKGKGNFRDFIFNGKKIAVTLKKDRLYYPDSLELTVTNTGKKDLDIDRPLLVFSSIWLKRKFVLKGTHRYNFYPLFLEQGQSHKLNIDLNRFYAHDRTLKRLPKVKITLYEVKGKKLGSSKVLLRKTLFNF
jgi:hypothetical protein